MSIPDDFPFGRALRLHLLVDHWRGVAANATGPRAAMAAELVDTVSAVPELLGPITDPRALEPHRDLVDALMSAVFPTALSSDVAMAAIVPYRLESVYSTSAFDALAILDRLGENASSGNAIMHAYHRILERFYDTSTDYELPFLVRARIAHGIDGRYRLRFDERFCDVTARTPPPRLDPADISRLLAASDDLDLWQRTLPPENFNFDGFVILTATDVTDREVLSALTRDLLQKDAMATPAHVEMLQSRLRTLLQRADLRLGLICLHTGADGVENAHAMGHSLLLSSGWLPECPHRADSLYARVLEGRDPLVVHDLASGDSHTGFERHLLSQGVRNVVLAPLRLDERIIGVLELASPTAGALNTMSAARLFEVSTLFATAMKRSLDDEETRLQAVIRQQFTAIHPAVEWRFREAAAAKLAREGDGVRAAVEPIVFAAVHPLYGLSDIRGSSTQRAEAIQADLLEQLTHARAVLDAVPEQPARPALSELGYRIDRLSGDASAGLTSGDEARALEFLRQEVEPTFADIRGELGDRVDERIDLYRTAIDPRLGVLYRRRRAYEDSVTLINDTIAGWIDTQQAHAQAILPHYFEKYRTDGVDYNMYVGASLLEAPERFKPHHLRDLKLWQLEMMCGVVWELERIRPALPVALEVAHLVLAQHSTLAIRFRVDEKQFDVDGAYNARYEIVKKRIDKARVRGAGGQLTQPGMLAVVYAQPREAVEYARYLEYLESIGFVEAGVEELDVEDLQGVRGLKALRVKVAGRGEARRPASSPARKAISVVR